MSFLLLAGAAIGAGANTTRSQDAQPRTVAAARAAAIPLLRAAGMISDTARVAADLADLYDRFVTCQSADKRTGCLINGPGTLTMMSLTLASPDTALIDIHWYYNQTQRCPGGPAISPPVISFHSRFSYRLVYADGRWGKLLRLSGVAC